MLTVEFLNGLGFEKEESGVYSVKLNVSTFLEYSPVAKMCALSWRNGMYVCRVVIPKVMRSPEDMNKLLNAIT